MSLSTQVIYPIAEEDLPVMSGEAHGFVAAQLGKPFRTVPIRLVSQEQLGRSLMEMIEELKELSPTESRLPQLAQDLLQSGQKWVAGSFIQIISKRILGLYKQSYINDAPGELLLVGENITNVSRELDLPLREFFLWVLVHETTHIAQFNTPGSYLRDHIKESILEITSGKTDSKQALQKASTAMTWIEGSADAMMDQEGLIASDLLREMREKTEARRRAVSWSTVLLQVLTRKNAQYREGRRFVEEVARRYGMKPMSLIIENPEWLPSAEEIQAPSLWVQRYEQSFQKLG